MVYIHGHLDLHRQSDLAIVLISPGEHLGPLV
jgi:hypothetical protein